MIKQISDLVKQYGHDAVVNNPEIPNEVNSSILAEATSTITGGMQNMLAGGGLKDIISMFTGAGGNESPTTGGIGKLLKNPMVAMMVGHLISKLVGKYNMNPTQASGVANNLIPNVLNGLVTRTTSQDPENDAFDLNDLIGSLTGGKVATSETSQSGFNFQEIIERVTGGNDGPGNSGFNLQDIISQVTNGAVNNKEQEAKSGSGLADLVKGFFS